jgi:hypothetical protein
MISRGVRFTRATPCPSVLCIVNVLEVLSSSHSGAEKFSQFRIRCSMVSISSQRSQLGESIMPDLNALLFVQIVMLRTSNADSIVLEGNSGILSTLYASLNVCSSGR